MFKVLQVLRTKVPLKSETGKQIPPQTRVVVMSYPKSAEGRVKVKVAGSTADLNDQRLVAGEGAFNTTHAGRPEKV